MKALSGIFGRSPFEPMVEHARKVHECVALVRPVADAIVAGDMKLLAELQQRMSDTEFEADRIKDRVRQNLPARYFLPVDREDMGRYLAQMDRIADEAENFAVVATFRKLDLRAELRAGFLALVDKVVSLSESLLSLAELLAQLQKESFVGAKAEEVLEKIQGICHMEWESDKLSRELARQYYSMSGLDTVTIILLDKLCEALRGIADHAENVGKNLRLIILRR